MNEIKAYAERCLNFSKRYSRTRQEKLAMFNQAFGAISFYVEQHPESEIEMSDFWNEINEKFFE